MKEKLPDFILAGLFTDSLVLVGEESRNSFIEKELPTENIIAEVSKSQKIYLGNYEKKIVVLVNDAANIYVDDDSLNFLTGILNACKLNLAHIALINFDKNALDFNHLKKELSPAYLLLFGINALQIQMPFTMPDYQVQDYNNCKILIAPSLTDLNKPTDKAKAEKTKLWKSLKKMFDIEK